MVVKVLSPFLLVAFCVMLAVTLICIAVCQSAQSSHGMSALTFMLFQHFISKIYAAPGHCCSFKLTVKMLLLAATSACSSIN